MSFQVIINTAQQHPIITLKNSNNSSADIYAFGGFVNGFSVTTTEGFFNVIDGFTSVDDAIENVTRGFKSSFLSPFTCRMKNGEFKLGDTGYKIDKFYLPPHALHGILYDAVYDIIATEANDEEASVSLVYNYKGDDKGYPFAFSIMHKWVLKANNHLSVITTLTHSNKHTIPYAQGWHPYFKLGTAINNCTLQFDSNTMLEFDDTLLPTGKYITRDEFANGTLLKDIFIDNCFELSKTIIQPKCVLSYNDVSITILPDGSYPYLQLYTPDHRQSIAIENISGAPDCFNNGIGLRLIEPCTSAIFTTSYIVTATHS